jgi:hypothetical protein
VLQKIGCALTPEESIHSLRFFFAVGCGNITFQVSNILATMHLGF